MGRAPGRRGRYGRGIDPRGECGPMHIMQNLLRRMFGQPRGFLGRLGGVIMARANDACGGWVTELLNVASNETVLEVGFGPGTAIRRLSAMAAHVAGVDASREMVAQAKARNAIAVKNGRVELLHGTGRRIAFCRRHFPQGDGYQLDANLAGCHHRPARNAARTQVRRYDCARVYPRAGDCKLARRLARRPAILAKIWIL